MVKEIKLQISDTLLSKLELNAERQGVSLEALCLSLLKKQDSEGLTDLNTYYSLSGFEVKQEIEKVKQSSLPREEIRKRVRLLENATLRRIR